MTQAPPQYSADGRWWWNGQRWVPVERFVPEPEPEAEPQAPVVRRRGGGSRLAGLALIAIIALAMVAAFVLASSLAGRRTGSATPAKTPVAQNASPSAAPTASPGQSQVIPAAQYIAAVGPAVASAAPRWAADGQSCTADPSARCRSAMADIQSSARDLKKVLDENPAPACLKTADQSLRSVVSQLDQGSGQVIQGIDAQNPLTIAAGASSVMYAGGQLREIFSDLRDSECAQAG